MEKLNCNCEDTKCLTECEKLRKRNNAQICAILVYGGSAEEWVDKYAKKFAELWDSGEYERSGAEVFLLHLYSNKN